MAGGKTPDRGDIYWIDPNPVIGREMQNRHPFVVITRREINRLGASMTVPITSKGATMRKLGLAVEILGREISGVAVCNQIRSFDIEEREKRGSARYVETLDEATIAEIIARVVSAIDPEV